MKISELIKLIENDGWYAARQKGSHIHFRHNSKKGLVTISFHKASKDVPPGTLKSVLKQAQIHREEI